MILGSFTLRMILRSSRRSEIAERVVSALQFASGSAWLEI